MLLSLSINFKKNQILNDKSPECKIGRCSGVVKPVSSKENNFIIKKKLF